MERRRGWRARWRFAGATTSDTGDGYGRLGAEMTITGPRQLCEEAKEIRWLWFPWLRARERVEGVAARSGENGG